jgi:uncharacterized membrane protein
MDLHPHVWLPSVYIAIAVVIGVGVGYAIQRLTDKVGVRVLGTSITAAMCLVLAGRVWLDTRSWYLVLPFAGVLVGLFRRRDAFASVFTERR